MFVEGAQLSDGRMRACALRALNMHLRVFRGNKGKFTIHQAGRLLEAAETYMADPANQIDLTRPVLVGKKGGVESVTQKPATRLSPQSSESIAGSTAKKLKASAKAATDGE